MKSAMIILNYNDGERTKKLAEHVSSFACLTHIIIVDNCSTDNSLTILQTAANEKIHVIQSPNNGGYARGNHFGMVYVCNNFEPDYIFIANPDIMVTEHVISSILEAMNANPAYGVISCLVNQGYNVWNLPGFWGVIESLFLIWFNIDKRKIKHRLAASAQKLETVGVVEGSFFCISKTAYEKTGGLDERTFLYGEEIMLAKRLQNNGYLVGILTKERYDHFHSVSIKKIYKSKAKAFYHFRDSFRIYNKYYLHTGKVQGFLFETAYLLAYAERIVYDLIMKLKR